MNKLKEKFKNMTKNQRLTMAIVFVVALSVIGVSYAYFTAVTNGNGTSSLQATTSTVDNLVFKAGDPISIDATAVNFQSGTGNLNGSTTSSATLIANTGTHDATATYQVYFDVTNNNFIYTTADNQAELVLTVKDPDGKDVTSISGLTYVTSGGVSGFDITTKTGLIKIAEDYSIHSTDSTTGFTQN